MPEYKGPSRAITGKASTIVVLAPVDRPFLDWHAALPFADRVLGSKSHAASVPVGWLLINRDGALCCSLSTPDASADEMSKGAAEQRKAHSAGQYAGLFVECEAKMCPYSHDQLDLRMAWMDGFSKGRAQLISGETSPSLRRPSFRT